jgi:uncharacterized protein YlaI
VNRRIQRKINKTGQHKCEVCNEPMFLEQHHIRGRKISNPHIHSNLANICANCHTKIHYGIIVVEGRYLTSDGYKLIWHYYKDNSITGNDAKPWII